MLAVGSIVLGWQSNIVCWLAGWSQIGSEKLLLVRVIRWQHHMQVDVLAGGCWDMAAVGATIGSSLGASVDYIDRWGAS